MNFQSWIYLPVVKAFKKRLAQIRYSMTQYG